MELFVLMSLLLFFTGCCAGRDVLPEGPVEGVLGENVTVRTLVDQISSVFIVWNYSNEKEMQHVAILDPRGLTVNALYEGRVSINPINGYLTLGPLKLEDSGNYSIIIIMGDGTTESAETQLLVLSPTNTTRPPSAAPETTEQHPAPTTTTRPPSAPETTEQCPGYTEALIACSVVIILLLAGYPLLYKWMENKRSKPSNGTNVEVSVIQLKDTDEDSTYQVLNPASMDQDQTYSTLK